MEKHLILLVHYGIILIWHLYNSFTVGYNTLDGHISNNLPVLSFGAPVEAEKSH